MTRCLMVLTVVGLLCTGVASAAVQQGDTELNLLLGFTTQSSAGATATMSAAEFDSWFLSAGFGYLLTDNLQVEVAGMGAWTSTTIDNLAPTADADVDVDMYGFGLRGRWFFMPTNQWVPYVGLQIFFEKASIDASDIIATMDVDVDGNMWGPMLGLRYELNETNDFYVEYQYQMWGGDVGDLFDDGHGLFAGIVHQFK